MSPKIISSCLAVTGSIVLGACSKGEKAADKVEPAKTEPVASTAPVAHSGEHGTSHLNRKRLI